MNMKNLMIAFIGLLIFSSCGADRSRVEKISAMIAQINDPYMIASVSPQTLLDKSGIMEDALPKMAADIVKSYVSSEQTGIDYEEDVQIIMGNSGSINPSVHVYMKLKNLTAFEKMIKNEAGLTINELDGFKYASDLSQGAVMVWDEEFLVGTNIDFDMDTHYSGEGDLADVAVIKSCIEMIRAGNKAIINDSYVAFLEKENDVQARFIGANFYEFLAQLSNESEELMEQEERIKAMEFDMSLNFNDGKINMDMVFNTPDSILNKGNFMAKGGISEDLMGLGLSVSPMMAFDMHLDIDYILTFIRENFNREFSNFKGDFYSEMGIDLESLLNASTGEMLWMVDNLSFVKDDSKYGFEEMEVDFAVVIGIKDKNSLMKQIPDSILSASDQVIQRGDAYIYVGEKYLFASNDSLWANNVKEKGGELIKPDGNWDAEKPMNFYLDCKPLTASKELKDVKSYTQVLNKISMQSDQKSFHLEISFIDEKVNALRTIVDGVKRDQIGEIGNGMGDEFSDDDIEAAIDLLESL
jgi:hypothetical protein